MINGIVAREDFKQGVRIFSEAFGVAPEVAVDKFSITQSDLRLEQPLVANQGQYTFPALVNIQNQGTGPFNTEIRLNNQDTFLPQYLGVFLANPSSNTDTTFKLSSYANPVLFPIAYAQMQAIYNGNLKIAVNNKNLVTKWMLERHEFIPQTQQTAAIGPASPVDQKDGGEFGYYPMQPYVIISGSANTEITINLPAAPTAVEAYSRLVIVFRGLIGYNTTVTT